MRDEFKVRMHPDSVKIPHTWRTPRTVFVNSMGDLFHEQVPVSFIQEVFAVMNDTPQHTDQVLTKRSKRLLGNSRAAELDTKHLDGRVGRGQSSRRYEWTTCDRVNALNQIPLMRTSHWSPSPTSTLMTLTG
jgi:protein gp37